MTKNQFDISSDQVVLSFELEQSDPPPWNSARPHRLNLTITNRSPYELVRLKMDPAALVVTGAAKEWVNIVNSAPIEWARVKPGETVAPDDDQDRRQLFVDIDRHATPMAAFKIDGKDSLTYDVKGNEGGTGSTQNIQVNP